LIRCNSSGYAEKNRDESKNYGLAMEIRTEKIFTDQFTFAQEYVECSLAEALKWMDRHHSKEIKGYVDL
tara:strand:+ start:465 stop:671 length:207 start_codon:yes stop_codon:yes gene_type:complete